MPSQRSKRAATTESLRAHEAKRIAAEALRSTLLQSPAGAAKRRGRRVNVYNGPSDTSEEEDDEGTGDDETSTETPLQRIRLNIGVGNLHKKTQALADELMDEERSSSPPPPPSSGQGHPHAGLDDDSLNDVQISEDEGLSQHPTQMLDEPAVDEDED
jgi:hypothetical protein